MQVEGGLPDLITQSPHALVVSHRSALFVFLCLLWPFPAKIPLPHFAKGSSLSLSWRHRRISSVEVGREKELPTKRDLGKWYGWLESYESVKTYIENHPELEREAVRIIKSQCPVYDDIPSYPYGRFSAPTPKQGKPQEWHCTWRLLRRDRHFPLTCGFTLIGGGAPGESWHRIEPTVEKAIKDYKKKLKLAEGQHPELPCVPLILFVDGRTVGHNLDKDDLDFAFARGVWKGGPSKNYPKIPLGVVVLGTPMRGWSQSGRDMVGDFIHNPY